MSTVLKGACQCGKVTFEVAGDPAWVGNCHCADCRHATGAAFSTFVGCKKTQVTWGKGTPSGYASSEGVRRTFCDRCGSPIAYEGIRWADEVHFYVGLFEHPEIFVPKGAAYEDEKLPWLHLVDGS